MSATPTPTRLSPVRRSATTDLALVATFAAVIAVCSIVGDFKIGISGTPMTLQMFAIFLAGMVLGARRGFLAVLLYLVVGTAGLPVFASHTGGPSVWAGATGGYLVAFPIAAFLVGLVASRVTRLNPAAVVVILAVAAAVVDVAVVTTFGTVGMALKLNVSLGVAWGYATPFIFVDILKGIAAAIVAASVHRAFPQLVGGR